MPEPFHYTNAIARLCDDMCTKLPSLQHISMDRVCVAFAKARANGRFGTWAFLTPLRFPQGKKCTRRNGILYTIDDLNDRMQRPYLYVLSVVMPRFQNLTLREKYQTIIHELYHISENFDGDIRRFPGRCYAHGPKGYYEKIVRELANEWLAKDPPPELWDFLKYDFNSLIELKGRLAGTRVNVPRPRPLDLP